MDELLKWWNALGPLVTAGIMAMIGTVIMGKFLRTIVVSVLDWFVKRTDNKIDDQLLQVVEDDLNVKPIDLSAGEKSDKSKQDGEKE